MKCPVCNNEMEQGFLQGMKRVAWVKKQHKVSLLPKQGEILLVSVKYFSPQGGKYLTLT